MKRLTLYGCLLGIFAFGAIGVGVLAFSGCAPVYGDAPTTPAVSVPAPINDGVARAAVDFALDHVDPTKYNGWNGQCPGTILDALRFRAFHLDRGYSVVLLTNEQATAFRVLSACVAATAGMKADDEFALYGSSHGGQVPDLDGDEGPGKQDSTICLWDGQLVDDLIGKMLERIPAGVKVTIIFDMCNTGSMYRGTPHTYARVFRARGSARAWDIKCSGVYMGGCGDGQSSYGGDDGGAFSTRLLPSWVYGITWIAWFDKAAAKMPRNQVPVFATFGPRDLRNEEAFK